MQPFDIKRLKHLLERYAGLITPAPSECLHESRALAIISIAEVLEFIEADLRTNRE